MSRTNHQQRLDYHRRSIAVNKYSQDIFLANSLICKRKATTFFSLSVCLGWDAD